MKISIHQPYFVPYRGYFRLLSEADLFVALDDVQHIRRGFVHRNRLPDVHGRLQWLTLPLAYAPQSALINELRFSEHAMEQWDWQMSRFKPLIHSLPDAVLCDLIPLDSGGAFVPYAMNLLRTCADHLGIKTKMIRASELGLPRELHGQDRIIAICQLLGETHYLNAPGGRALYDETEFASHGIKLEFLPSWDGPMSSVLEHLACR